MSNECKKSHTPKYQDFPIETSPRSKQSECMKLQRADVSKVRQDTPHFPSYLSFDCRPISVTYDARTIRLNDQPVIFLSGSLHPVRETAATWEQALDEAVASGLNMVTIYVMWSAHETSQNAPMDWSFQKPALSPWKNKKWDLASAISGAASRGLFVHLRIGPYVCAEYSYGGIPEFLALARPNMSMRRPNVEWMEAMTSYVNATVSYMTGNSLWAHQGGPIVIAQIENEIGGEVDLENDHFLIQGADMQDYANWAGKMAQEMAPEVTWTMCNGNTAPNCINTCNGYGEDSACSTKWLEHHGQNNRVQIDQPALWTEDESGFQMWGDSPSKPSDYFWGRTANEFGRDGVRWFARGGSHLNYYMFSGGYNRGRSAAAGIRNAYASDAILCPCGERRQPKFDHLRNFHSVIAHISEALATSPSALQNPAALEIASKDFNGELIWILGSESKQRMFAYSSAKGQVTFIENDSSSAEKIRVEIQGGSGYVEIQMQPESALILLDGEVLFDSATVSKQAHQYERKTAVVKDRMDWRSWLQPVGGANLTLLSSGLREQTEVLQYFGISSDYLWYKTSFTLRRGAKDCHLKVRTEKASAFLAFVDEKFVGDAANHEHGEGSIQLWIPCGNLEANRTYSLSLLSESLGYHNLIGRWGAKTTAKTKGVYGVMLICNDGAQVVNLSNGSWQFSPVVEDYGSATMEEPKIQKDVKPKWSVSYFATPEYDTSRQRLFVNMTQGRGHLYINGLDLGRFWNISRNDRPEKRSQQYYYLPSDLLRNDAHSFNELKVFDVFGSDLSQSVSLVLSWIESNSSLPLIMKDIVDFDGACLI